MLNFSCPIDDTLPIVSPTTFFLLFTHSLLVASSALQEEEYEVQTSVLMMEGGWSREEQPTIKEENKNRLLA
jgi:hypothetical protein